MINSIITQFEKIVQNIKNTTDTIKEVDGHSISMYSYYYNTCQLIKKALLSDNTQPLIIPIIKNFMNDILPYYQVSMSEIISGEYKSKLEDVNKLYSLIDESDIDSIWLKAKTEYCKIMDKCHFKYSNEMMEDIINVADIIINASVFLTETYKGKNHKRLSTGKTDDNCEIKLYNQIIKSNSDYDFFNIIKQIKEPNVVIFGAITKTIGDMEDKLDEEIHGHPSEVVCNYSRIYNLSYDETRKMNHDYYAELYIGIKRGENIWFISGSDVDIIRNKSFFKYGKRDNYFPLQVLFNDFEDAKMPDKKTELMIPNLGWKLSEILDEEQSLWFTVLFSQLINKYYKAELIKDAKTQIFREDISVGICMNNSNANLPSINIVPDLITEELDFKNLELLRILNIKKEDCFSENLAINGLFEKEELINIINKNAKRFLKFKIKKAFSQYYIDNINDAHKWYFNNQNCLNRLSKLKDITQYIEHGKPIVTLDGKTVLLNKEPKIGVTSIDDVNLFKENVIYTESASYGKRPSARFDILPTTSEDIMRITNSTYEELPDILKLFDFIKGKDSFVGFIDISPSEIYKINNRMRFKHFHITIASTKKDAKQIINALV